ncbi:MAG: hypothetical protein GY906_29170 [bacterium]|nr:hypothetical protein [bacterium]
MVLSRAWRVVAFGMVLSSLLCGGCTQPEATSALEISGPFLGMESPGFIPEVFAPGVISTEGYEGCAVFLDEGRVLVFNRLTQGLEDWTYIPIHMMRMGTDGWSSATPVTFQDGHVDDNFTAAPEGRTVYFQSHRPRESGDDQVQFANIWRVTWEDGDWTEPELMVTVDDEPLGGGYPSITHDGTIYFMSGRYESFGEHDIYRSQLVDGKYGPAENLGPEVNSEHIELDSFVAADESYLLLCSDRPGGRNGEYDLYVSFRNDDGSWGEAINMGPEINSGIPVSRPNVTPDGRFLFFCRHPGETDTVYWVDARIIEKLRAEGNE